MLTAIARLVVARPRAVLLGSLLALVAAAVAGTGVFTRLAGGGFDAPDAESVRAAELLEERFGTGPPNVVLLVTPSSGDLDSVADIGLAIAADLADQGVDDVVSYWSLGGIETLAAADGSSALVLGRVPGDPDSQAEDVPQVEALAERWTAGGLVEVGVGGELAVFEEIGTTIEGDLARAEAIALPATMLLLVLVFGGLVAASLPLMIGVTAIFGAFGALYLISLVADVSIFSINLVTALGLGLAIDYSLFVVSRFREELGKGTDVARAVTTTVTTAGRTVAFSGLTVAASLSALLVFPLYFLRSFAYGGLGVIVVALLASVVTLPAALVLIGHRVDALSIGSRGQSTTSGFWRGLAGWVMDRPLPVALAVSGLLVAIGLPFLGVRFGLPDDRVLPAGADSREVSEVLRSEYDSREADALSVVAVGGGDDSTASVAQWAAELSSLDSVERVDSIAGSHVAGGLVAGPSPLSLRFVPPAGLPEDPDSPATWLSVVPSVEAISAEAERLVADIRSVDSGFDEVAVAGRSASLVDTKAAIADRLPLAAGIIAVVTFVLLFAMFGSVLVPLKAILLNLLSLTATFGLMVLIFQEGVGAGFFGVTATGFTDTTTPILMFCIAFGLSMDYEVFLLSRISEEYERTGDNRAAVVAGLERTGRIVTAAAVLLAVTFFAFATSGVSFITLFGFGLGVAILVDATIVRGTLVPALMALAGEWNWWAPGWMKAVHRRIALSEAGPATATSAAATGTASGPDDVVGRSTGTASRRRRSVFARTESALAPAHKGENLERNVDGGTVLASEPDGSGPDVGGWPDGSGSPSERTEPVGL